MISRLDRALNRFSGLVFRYDYFVNAVRAYGSALQAELEKSDAFIAAWLPGTKGQGVADVLFGDYKPTGKLSFTWPSNKDQFGLHKGDKGYKPLFETGYGLTY